MHRNGILSFVRPTPSPSHTPDTTPPLSPDATTPRSGSIASTIEGIIPERKSRRSSMDKVKRASITSITDLGGKGKKKKASVGPVTSKDACLELIIESPPLTFYGPKQESTGALFSGLIKLHVSTPVTIQEWTARIDLEYTTKKPVHKDCRDCATKTTQVRTWTFFPEPVTLDPGEHTYPVNHLIKGDLPATTHGAIGHIEYHFHSLARTSSGELISLHKPLPVWRALKPPEHAHMSKRIFPPTKLELEMEMPKVIHPIGEIPLHMRMKHLCTTSDRNTTRWRIRKCSWHIDEEMRVMAPACAKHANRPGSEGKSMLHNSVREIGAGNISEKWKHDWNAADDGIGEVEFTAAIDAKAKATCDVEARAASDVDSGTSINVEHTMHVEMVIVEEFAPHSRPDAEIPTGNARVLKAKFRVIVTERMGLGISWDQEMPPVYDDVPPSPPNYAHMEDFDLNALPAEERGSSSPMEDVELNSLATSERPLLEDH